MILGKSVPVNELSLFPQYKTDISIIRNTFRSTLSVIPPMSDHPRSEERRK